MWPIILGFVRNYAPYITLPIAAIVGVIGYGLEGLISDKHTPTIESIKEQREKRLLEEVQVKGSINNKDFVPKTIFEKNLSPSLQERS